MSKEVSFSVQQAIAENAELHTGYSGRFMYGKTCLGFSIDDGIFAAIGNIIASLAGQPEQLREFAEMLADSRTDSLGLGQIVYFPHWSAIESTGEECKPCLR